MSKHFLTVFTDGANLSWAAVTTLLVAVFGAHWYIFAFFLALNVVDYAYGVMKSRATDTLSSAKGAQGIVKKLSYWVIIALAFAVAQFFIGIGAEIGLNLSFLRLLGWFVLATYIVNELTSIVENMVILGVDVPDILVRGLHVVRDMVDDAGDKVVPQEKEEDN